MNTLAEQWCEQVSEGAVLLTVNQRLSRHHMAAYQRWQLQSEMQWWETPSILPLRSWMKNLHRQALGLGLSERCVMPSLLVQQVWRHIIDADSSVQLLDPAGAARSALQAWELSCVWKCNNPDDQYLSIDQFTWQRWMRHYRSTLDNRSAIDEALLPDELVRIIGSASNVQLERLLPKAIILDGFLQLPSQLQDLMQCIEACGVDVVLREACADAVVHTCQYPDDEAELLGIATQMRDALEHDKHQMLGLIVPDLQKRRDEVVRAFEQVFYPGMSPLQISREAPVFEVSLGQPLSDQPVVMMALSLLRLAGASIGSAQLSATILSPYWLAAEAEAQRRAQFDRRLRDDRVSSLTLEQLQSTLYKASKLNPAINKLLKQRKLKAATLSEWADRFSQWLDILGWPTSSIDSEEYQAVSAWLECLDDLQTLDDGVTINFNSAFVQLRQLASERVFQVETPATPVQVVGRLESHGLRFDCLWVAGLDAEQWPPAGSPTAFLSMEEQKRCNIPDSSAAQRLSLAEKEYRLWASQAPLLVVSTVQVRDGKALSDALLPDIQASFENQKSTLEQLSRLVLDKQVVDPLGTISRALSLESINDFYGPVLVEGENVAGGARLFENQALCPFKAFALHRLKIRPLEEVGLGLDARQHGNLLHVALELFWKRVKTHATLREFDDDKLDEVVLDVVQESMKEHNVPGSLWALELERLCALVRAWIVQCELPRQPFEVLEMEKRQSIVHGGIEMNVIIDRIDRVGDALVVIDYKTGVNNRVSTWADERISNPQLPLYVLTDEEIMAASFAQVATNQLKFIGLAQDDEMLPNVATRLRGTTQQDNAEPITQWADWRAHWRTSLDAIAQELRDGVATVTPMKSACTFCELQSLCRIKPEEASSVAAESEDEDAASLVAGVSVS